MIDPYSLGVTPPGAFSDSTVIPYLVTINPNNNFQGQVTVVPAVTATGGTASISPSTGTTVGVTASTGVTFSVTIGSGVSSVVLSASTSSGGLSLATGNSTIATAAAYSVAVTSEALSLFSGVTNFTGVTVQVTYNGSYNATVTISAPATLPAGIASITPGCGGAQPAQRGRFVGSVRAPRGGAASQTVTPTNTSVCFQLNGTSSGNVSPGSAGTLTFTTTDGANNNSSAAASYTIVDPFSIAPSNIQPAQGVNVNIIPNNGFTGFVTITPSLTSVGGTLSPSSNPVSPVSVSVATQVTVNANPDTNVTSFSGSVSFGVGGFSLTQNVPTQYIKGYTLTSNPASQVNMFTGIGASITISAAYTSPFSGTILVTAPVVSGVTICVQNGSSCSGLTGTITPSQTSVTFTATASNASNPVVGQWAVHLCHERQRRYQPTNADAGVLLAGSLHL